MPTLLNYATHQAVARDGLPRVADYDDGSQQVLFLDGDTVRSMPAADWPPPLPTDPTPAEIAAAIAARQVAQQQAESDALALRQRVRTIAQSAVGVQVDQLTAIQVRALIAVLLHKAGALDKSGAIRALDTWGD
jgi:hypothetical protein